MAELVQAHVFSIQHSRPDVERRKNRNFFRVD
jgi:hypothetical protein